MVTIGFNRVLARVGIDDLDRDDWTGAMVFTAVPSVESELRPGLTLVQIVDARHPRSGDVALAVVDAPDQDPHVLILSGELAFRGGEHCERRPRGRGRESPALSSCG